MLKSMLKTTSRELDLIEEFRLRAWARENFVPATERDPSWHPIILEEMSRKDREAADRPLAS